MYLVCSLILVIVCVAIVACLVSQVISFTSVLAILTLVAAAGLMWLFASGKNTQKNPTAKVEIVEKPVELSPPPEKPEKPESPKPRFTQLYQDTMKQKDSIVKRIQDAQEVAHQWKNQSKSKLEKAFTQRMGTNLARHRPCPERLYFASVNPTNDAYLIPISSDESKVAA